MKLDKTVKKQYINGIVTNISTICSIQETRCDVQNPESKKLISNLPEWNRKLHQKNAFGNDTFKRYLSYFDWLLGDNKLIRVMDYGCGSNGGIINYGYNSIPYDPFVDRFSEEPWDKPFEAVFSADVLEHMTVRQCVEFLKSVEAKTVKYVFLAIATRAANQILDNGINAHVTIESGDWWFGLCQSVLSSKMVCVLAMEDMITDNVVLGFIENKEAVKRGLDIQGSFLGGAELDAN